MRRVLSLLSVVFISSVPAFAQTATPSNRFALDQAAPDLATAQAYTFRMYADGATTGTVVVMTCTGSSSPFVCSTPVNAFTPGAHAITMTAANVAGESTASAALSFVMIIQPAPPTNLRIVQ